MYCAYASESHRFIAYVQVFDMCITKTGNTWRMDFEFIEDAFNYVVDVDPNDKESKRLEAYLE